MHCGNFSPDPCLNKLFLKQGRGRGLMSEVDVFKNSQDNPIVLKAEKHTIALYGKEGITECGHSNLIKRTV